MDSFESQRLTGSAFRITSAVVIDERRSVFYAGSVWSLLGRLGVKVVLVCVYEDRIVSVSRVIYETRFVCNYKFTLNIIEKLFYNDRQRKGN